MFAVIFETAYVTRILYEGSYDECEIFVAMNPEICDECSFIQELEMV